MLATASTNDRQICRYLVAGFGALALLVGGVGGWAATASLNAAVIAPGAIAVDTNSKRIQHPDGGVVGKISVHEGQLVREGDLLLRLDDTVTRANLMVVDGQLISLAARRARLEAERGDLPAIYAARELVGRESEPAVAQAIGGERDLFVARKRGRDGQTAQLSERIRQTREEVVGLDAQIGAKSAEVALIGSELAGVETLAAKGLAPTTRVTALKRENTRIEGERGQLVAEVARAKGRISETELQILQVDRDFRTEIAKELRDTETQLGEATEKKIAAEDRLRRVDIRAPRGGFVHQLAVHTIGGVVAPSDVLMFIVPKEDVLTLETRVGPNDIDQLALGQQAIVKLSGLNQKTTPELAGVVDRIAADLTHEKETGQSWFAVRVKLPAEELARLGTIKLIPGMPAEVFVQTGARTALSYLIKPLTDQFSHAMREE